MLLAQGGRGRYHGFDINPNVRQFDDPARGVRTHVGDQSDPVALRDAVAAAGGGFDIVIDDGSHVSSHLRATFLHLLPAVAPGGVYWAEDTQTCYWPSFGGGMRQRRSFIEFAKRRALRGGFPGVVAFYESVIVFDKAPGPPPWLQGPP